MKRSSASGLNVPSVFSATTALRSLFQRLVDDAHAPAPRRRITEQREASAKSSPLLATLLALEAPPPTISRSPPRGPRPHRKASRLMATASPLHPPEPAPQRQHAPPRGGDPTDVVRVGAKRAPLSDLYHFLVASCGG